MPPGFLVPASWILEKLSAPEDPRPIGDLTVSEVAEEFGRAESTVRTWLGQALIPGAYRLRGREWRVPPAALRQFLDREAERAQNGHVNGSSEAADLDSWRRHFRNGTREPE